jgi:hypothetical protein
MHARLIVIGGKVDRREVSLPLPVIIGRSRTAGLTIAHAMVSRKHCELYEAGGLVHIRDLGSTNGTYVGGNRVQEAVLRPRDQFTIGPLTFEVDYSYAEDSTIVDQQAAGLARAASPEAASPEAARPEAELAEAELAQAEPAQRAVAEAAPPSDAMSLAPHDGASDEPSVEDFELAGQADAFPPGEDGNDPAGFALAAEPPAEWAKPGPEIPPQPLFAPVPPEASHLASPSMPPESAFEDASRSWPTSDAVTFVGEDGVAQSEDLSIDFLASEMAPSEPPREDSQPTSLPPASPLRKPKKKSRWWPFNRGK